MLYSIYNAGDDPGILRDVMGAGNLDAVSADCSSSNVEGVVTCVVGFKWRRTELCWGLERFVCSRGRFGSDAVRKKPIDPFVELVAGSTYERG